MTGLIASSAPQHPEIHIASPRFGYAQMTCWPRVIKCEMICDSSGNSNFCKVSSILASLALHFGTRGSPDLMLGMLKKPPSQSKTSTF